VRKDGTQFWAHVVIDAIRSPEGKLVGFAKITRDLTERRAAETKLRESEEQLRAGSLPVRPICTLQRAAVSGGIRIRERFQALPKVIPIYDDLQ
jgi:PAS domain-containing protein